jgi:prohibitin 2
MGKLIGIALLVFVAVIVISAGTYIVQPGHRGVAVTLGSVAPDFIPEGFGFRQPFITHIEHVSVRQQTRALPAECYSSDLQQVKAQLRVLFRVPEQSVVKIFQDYAGDPFDSLIAPRVLEALKEAAAVQSAEMFVKKREEVKLRALELARRKIGPGFLEIIDLVLYDITLSPELETAIEQKMVQEQEAEKAKFTQLQTQIEADTAVIFAKGEAEAIAVRGQALRENPDFFKLQVVQTWNGHSPLVVGADGGANLLLPLDPQQRATTAPAPAPRPAPRP